MTDLPKDKFSFRTGAVASRDTAYFLVGSEALEEDEIAHTYVYQWRRRDEQWHYFKLPWTTASACIAHLPEKHMVAIGDAGQYLVTGPQIQYEGNIFSESERNGVRTVMRAVREIGGKAFAVGMGGIVLRQDAVQKWSWLDGKILGKIDIEAIDGTSEKNILVVGWDGQIWRFDGEEWVFVPTPTNLILTSVCCVGDRHFYCCGQQGTLLRGNYDQCELIAVGATGKDLWDVRWFGGELYVASYSFLYKLNGDALELVSFGEDPPESTYKLMESDGLLWSVGPKDVMTFDGMEWRRVA